MISYNRGPLKYIIGEAKVYNWGGNGQNCALYIEDNYHDKVKVFLESLEKVKQICKEKSEEFEKEKKQRKMINEKIEKNLEQFYGLVVKAIWQKYSTKKGGAEKLRFTLKSANAFLRELYGVTNRRFGPKCKGQKKAKSLAFVGILRDLLGPEFDDQIGQMQKAFYTVEKLENLRINGPKLDAKPIIDVQMSRLLYSFAARLEAMIHGKAHSQNSQKSAEKSNEIGNFLTTSDCFVLDEWVNTKNW